MKKGGVRFATKEHTEKKSCQAFAFFISLTRSLALLNVLFLQLDNKNNPTVNAEKNVDVERKREEKFSVNTFYKYLKRIPIL